MPAPSVLGIQGCLLKADLEYRAACLERQLEMFEAALYSNNSPPGLAVRVNLRSQIVGFGVITRVCGSVPSVARDNRLRCLGVRSRCVVPDTAAERNGDTGKGLSRFS